MNENSILISRMAEASLSLIAECFSTAHLKLSWWLKCISDSDGKQVLSNPGLFANPLTDDVDFRFVQAIGVPST